MVVVVESEHTAGWLEQALTAGWPSRAGVRDLARRMAGADPAAVDAAVDEGVARGEGHAAATLVLAQAANGRRPTAERVGPLFPFLTDDLVLEALLAAATGDRVALLVEAARSRRVEPNSTALGLMIATALLDGAPPPPGLLRELRLLAREGLEDESRDMLATCAQALKDPALLTLLQPWLDEMKAADAAPFDLVVLRRRMHGDPLELLPERDEAPAVQGDGTPLQAESKVGRNDPCPCGSGKKYKKCCETKAGPAASTQQKGRERGAEERAAVAAEGPLDPKLDTGGLGPAELLALAPERCATMAQLRDAYTGFIEWGLWAPAARFADALVARARAGETCPRAGEQAPVDPPPPPDAWRMDLLLTALQAGEAAVVLEQLERLDPALRDTPGMRLLGALAAPGPDALARLEEAAAAALRGDAPDCSLEAVALRVLLTHPALGALLARAALDPAEPEEQAYLLDEVERARDRLLLPPGDDYQRVLDALLRDREAAAKEKARAREEKKPRRKAAPAAEGEPEEDTETLRERLRAAATRASELEEEVRRLRARREEARGALRRPAADAAPADPVEVARLREKVAKLEAVLQEGQEERRELRRALQELEEARARDDERARAAADAEGKRDDEDAEEGPGLEAPDEKRPALLPVFSDNAAAAIREADRSLGRAALRVVAGVAGGDPQVWSQVKRLRRRTDVCSARVGIHHRLLFRLHPSRGELEVVSFINRRELDATIRRLG